jgi:hypothetical protein
MIYDISKWSTEQLVDLLNHSGYSSDDIVSCYYKQTLSEGHIVFNIDYENLDGELESGNVFVFIRDGKLVAEF